MVQVDKFHPCGPIYPAYQYHRWWWPGTTRSQGSGSHGINLLISEYFISSIKMVNALRPGQNGKYFADCIFGNNCLQGNLCALIQISLMSHPMGPMDKRKINKISISPRNGLAQTKNQYLSEFWRAQSELMLVNVAKVTETHFIFKPNISF